MKKIYKKTNESLSLVGYLLSDTEFPRQAKSIVGQNLNNYNSYTHAGFYYAGGSNNCTNKPSEVDAFGLQILRTADGYIQQILYASNNSKGNVYVRSYDGGTWSSWKQLGYSDEDLEYQTIDL